MTANGGEGLGELPAYRAIDPDVHVGQIPLAQCIEIQNTTSNQDLGPDAQFDLAWLRLETSMAMISAATARGDRSFTAKELNAARQQAQTGFREILRNEQLPLSLRAASGLALASVGVHHTMTKRQSFTRTKDHISYLKGLQQAAQLLLSKENRTPEDDELLRTMTSIAVPTEYVPDSSWFLPAPPRQPWHINAVNQKRHKLARVMIANEVPDGIMSIPLDALGDDLWGKDGPHATLATYVELPPGFALARNKKNPGPVVLAFDEVARRYFDSMNRQEHAKPSAEVPAAEMEQPGEMDRIEISWYMKQPAGDFRNLPPSTLRLHILNLEEAQERGELDPSEQNVLGWMQLEYARILVAEAEEKRNEANRARIQETRVSRLDAPAFAAAATNAEAAAGQLMITARERFDQAKATFDTAANALPKARIGETFEMLMYAEAAAVYKGLFTEADPATLAKTVENYIRHLAGMYAPMRAAEHSLERGGFQADMLHITALKAALCLLISNSSDEAVRDLALPAPLRTGGIRGQMSGVVFPLDYMHNSYDGNRPVNVQINEGAEITHDRHYVSVGIKLLAGQKANPLDTLAKLTADAHAAGSPTGKRKRLRGEALNDLAYRVADAIADAAEA